MNVSLIGLDGRTEQSVLLVLKHRAKGAVHLVGEDEADVVILDLESDMEKSMDRFRELRSRKPSIHAIGLSSKVDPTFSDILVLQKPLSAGRLLDGLQQVTGMDLQLPSIKTAGIATSLNARIVSSKRDATSRSLSESDRHFDPRAYLLGSIFDAELEAKQKDKVAVIKFYGDRFIYIDDRNQTIGSNLTAAQMRAFSIVSSNQKSDIEDESIEMRDPSVEFISHEKARKGLFDVATTEPRETFMWRLGVMTSRGRLPFGTTMEERLCLHRWPNMTRLSYTENSLRIIAYWIRSAASLHEITEALGVSDEEVINVYAGIYAAGLTGKAAAENDLPGLAKTGVERKERGILSSILKRLQQRKPPVAERVFA